MVGDVRRYTRDRSVIQAWAEERGGRPARVRGMDVPRLAFGPLPPNWEPLEWPAFFALLDRADMGLMYEDSPGSRICKLVKGRTLGD